MRYWLSILVLVCLQVSGQEQKPIDPLNFDPDLLAEAIFEATNELRHNKGLKTLKQHKTLDAAANFQASKMARTKKLQHNWPKDRRHKNLSLRLKKYGGDFEGSSENIARDYLLDFPSGQSYYIDEAGNAVDQDGELIPMRSYSQLAQEVVQGWYRSEGHRKNLLGNYNYLGIGVSELVPEKKGPNFDVYLVQNFGK